MIKLYQFSCNEDPSNFDDFDRDILTRLEWSWGFGDKASISETISNVDGRYECLDDLMKQGAHLGCYISKINRTAFYTLVKTHAPKDYDFGDVIQIADLINSYRLVAIPNNSVENQLARYSSGLHASRKVD